MKTFFTFNKHFFIPLILMLLSIGYSYSQSATTNAETNVTATTATLNGSFVMGGTTFSNIIFRYATAAAYTGNGNSLDGIGTTITASPSSLSSDGSVSADISGLTDGTTYYFRVEGTQNTPPFTTHTGDALSFTAQNTGGIATTQAANPVGSTTAKLNGVLDFNGSATWFSDVKFEWGTDASYGNEIAGDDGSGNNWTMTDDQPFFANLSGLTKGATYHFRIRADNSDDGSNPVGLDMSFTTIDDASVASLSAQNITSNSADARGSITDDGGGTISERGVVYNTTGTTPSIGSTGNTKVTSGSGTGGFTAPLSGLASGTTYYYRAYGTNEAGTTYGALETFDTEAAAPEMDVKGNGNSIADGDQTPTTTDNTDFGSSYTSITKVFVIENTGDIALNLTDDPRVYIGGTNADKFTVNNQPATSIATSGSSNFTVTFDPDGATGIMNAEITIANDDTDENPYNFYIKGTGAEPPAPEMDVQGNGTSISDGDITPSTIDDTDFGSTYNTISKIFTIENTGTADLTLSSTPKVYIGGSNAALFAVDQPTSPIAASGSATFTITFDPAGATGIKEANVVIDNNDTDENPYNFNIKAEGIDDVPIVNSTTAITNATNASANGGGNVSGTNITARGVIWKAGSLPSSFSDKDGFTEDGAGSGSFTSSLSSLSAETHYYVKAYATNSAGTTIDTDGNAKNFWTLSTEPTAHSGLTVTANNTTIIDLAFSAASGIGADGYLIFQRVGGNPTFTPSDATPYTQGNTYGDAVLKLIITNNSQTTAQITGLSPNTTYHYSLIPYNWDGTNNPTYNYYTEATIPTDNATTYSNTTSSEGGYWNNASNWSDGIPGPNTEAYINSGTVTVNSNVACGRLTIKPDAALTVNAGYTLTVNDKLISESDNTGMGSILLNGDISCSDIETNLYLSSGISHLITQPTTGSVNFADAFPGTKGTDYVAKGYLPASTTGTNLWDEGVTSLTSGEGYSVNYSATNATASFSGNLNKTDKTLDLYRSGGSEGNINGWNLLGNPFNSAIDWTSVSVNTTEINNAVYFWNGYNYVYYLGSGGEDVSEISANIEDPNTNPHIIPAMQGFFLQLKSGYTSSSLTIPASARVHHTKSFFKNLDPPSLLSEMLRLKVQNNNVNYSDETIIRFIKDADSEFDGMFDAYKLFTNVEDVPQIYTITNTKAEELAVNSLPAIGT